jgi:hypothetical protein
MSLAIERLQRHWPIEVRRDAAIDLPNNRRIYDAFFSRTGYQRYPRPDGSVSIEYRPPEEVFDADSLASLANLPCTLLHPSTNFGTEFGIGAYPIRGTTCGPVVAHSDGIHTAGKIMVWDREWNDAIESGEIAELSLGYTITPGPGGTGPDGTVYHVTHTEIVGDHCAGVPAGNAGTARVIVDALPDPAAIRATRRALADIAAMRADARPMVFDLGRWPAREPTANEDTERRKDQTMDKTKLATAIFDAVVALGPKATPKAIADAWVEICGSADDPAIRAASAALASAPQSTYVQAEVGQPSVAVEVEVGMQDAKARLDADRKALADERAKLALERKAIADAQSDRDDTVALARAALGVDWTTRLDSGATKTTGEIKREIVGKLDAAKLAKVDDYTDETKRAIALDLAVDACREKLDANREKGGGLLRLVQQTRSDQARIEDEHKARLDALAERHGGTPKAQST